MLNGRLKEDWRAIQARFATRGNIIANARPAVICMANLPVIGLAMLLSHLYTEEMLRTVFASTEMLELRAYDADLTEGTRHRG